MPLRLDREDLVLSHFSLPRDTPFVDRVAAAAGAGFAGIGWYVGDYVAHRERGWTDAQLVRVLDDHRVVLHEVDALPLDRLGLLDAAVHLATTFGVHHVQVQGNRPGTVEEAAAVIAEIADLVAGAGVRVAIEFVGDKNIETAADALALTELSERPNVGVQIDIWHHTRGADDWSMLEVLPLGRIVSVQLDDGPLVPADDEYTRDTVTNRRLPGEGEFDLVRFLRTVHPSASKLPVSLEIIASDLLALPVDEAARRMAAATRAVLARPELGL